MPHVNNVIFLKVSFVSAYHRQQFMEAKTPDYNLNPLPKISVDFTLTAGRNSMECARLFIVDQIH